LQKIILSDRILVPACSSPASGKWHEKISIILIARKNGGAFSRVPEIRIEAFRYEREGPACLRISCLTRYQLLLINHRGSEQIYDLEAFRYN
jgi:hypothetical protein